MKKDIAVYTNNGGHSFNEDSLNYGNNIFVVADGLGGHEKSEAASQFATDYLVERSDFDISPSGEQIISLLKKLNTAILGMQKKTGYTDSRTTIAAVWTGGEKFSCANVGDSRIYYFRNGRILFQSIDHSVCQASVLNGELDPRDIRQNPDRSKLLKVLGENKQLNLKPYPSIDMYEGDAFLICSDGFWDYVYEEEMEIDLHKSSTARDWMNYMLKRQLSRAENKGDNYSIICGIVSEGKKLPPIDKIKDILRPAVAILAAVAIIFAAAITVPKLIDPDKDSKEESTETSEETVNENPTEETPTETTKENPPKKQLIIIPTI